MKFYQHGWQARWQYIPSVFLPALAGPGEAVSCVENCLSVCLSDSHKFMSALYLLNPWKDFEIIWVRDVFYDTMHRTYISTMCQELKLAVAL